MAPNHQGQPAQGESLARRYESSTSYIYIYIYLFAGAGKAQLFGLV
jgi:hypothetical protein